MKILRLFDSLKFVRAMFIAVATAFILNVAHADIPSGYMRITSSNTTKYPETLTGYTKYTFNGSETWDRVSATGSGDAYYAHSITTTGTNIVGTGAQISNLYQNVAIVAANTNVGVNFLYSPSFKKTLVYLRDPSKFTSVSELKSYLNEHPLILLVKTTTDTDNVYQLVKRNSDDVIGYYCTTGTNAGDFVPAFGAEEYNAIKIATTKYNEQQFTQVETDLNAARTVINDLITQMQTNAINVSKLAVEKQTRPNADCPAGKNCLLVTDPTGAENWYEIIGANAVQSSSNVPDYFSFTTTALNAGDSVGFSLTPSGTFTVDWGDGSEPQVIERTNTTRETYNHSYANAGEKTIKITGRATGYSTVQNTGVLSFGNVSKIASIDGSLGAIFPTLGNGAGQQPKFSGTFANAPITSIPAGLFRGITGATDSMFAGTFAVTQITSIPENLFSGITGAAGDMFSHTFYNTPITLIPAGLFSGITDAAPKMFDSTFVHTQITSIPAGLFSGITDAAAAMFSTTFAYCPNLTGYIPESTFAGLIQNNSPYADSFMSSIFAASEGLATACPDGTTEVSTIYKSSYWNTSNGNYAVMCRPN